MPITLLRIDERLIHGQVVVGWGERLHMDRIVVVDDDPVLAERQPRRQVGVVGPRPGAHVDDRGAGRGELRQL